MMVLGTVPERAKFPPDDLSGLPTIQELRKRDKVRVLVNSYTPGLAARDTKDGPLYGFEIDLAKNLVRAIFGATSDVDSHIEFIEASNDLKIDMLLEHQVDMIIANLFDTPERREKLDFAGHYVASRDEPLLGPDCPEIHKPSDMEGLRIAVEAGTTEEYVLTRIAPSAEIVPTEHQIDWINALDDGSVQALWGDTIYNPAITRRPGNTLRRGNLRTSVGQSAVAINQDATDLRRFINDFIADALTTGQLQSSLRRWGL